MYHCSALSRPVIINKMCFSFPFRNGCASCSRTVFTLAISIQLWTSASPFNCFCAPDVQPRAKGHVSRSRYTLIQIFSKFGNLSRLDYLFHKSGPLRGKPRGYAFVEYAGEAVSAPSTPLSILAQTPAPRLFNIRHLACFPGVRCQ